MVVDGRGIAVSYYVPYRTLGHLQCPVACPHPVFLSRLGSSQLPTNESVIVASVDLSWSQLHKSSMPAGFRISESNQRICISCARPFRNNGISPHQLARQAKINSIDNADANHHTKTTWFLKDTMQDDIGRLCQLRESFGSSIDSIGHTSRL